MDAFDEGRVKAKEGGFEAFVDDIADIASKVSRAALVLFARTQTAQDIWFLLSEKGVTVCLLEIQHFERESANEYIDKRIKKLNAERWRDIYQRWEGPFREARDTIFYLLDRAIKGAGRASEGSVLAVTFLGYAPVLMLLPFY